MESKTSDNTKKELKIYMLNFCIYSVIPNKMFRN